MTEPKSTEVTEVTITRPIAGQFPVYPQAGAHTWGAFAFLAIELGGYGDMEVVNPYNGVRLNAPVFKTGTTKSTENNNYDALRLLIDEMEKVDFLNIRATDPQPERELTAADFGDVLLGMQVGASGDWAGILASAVTKRVGFVVTPEQAFSAWQRLRAVR